MAASKKALKCLESSALLRYIGAALVVLPQK